MESASVLCLQCQIQVSFTNLIRFKVKFQEEMVVPPKYNVVQGVNVNVDWDGDECGYLYEKVKPKQARGPVAQLS
jgi:hypothetical protein